MTPNPELPHPVEQEPVYDWRKGRQWKENRDYAELGGLEVTQEEDREWRDTIAELDAKKATTYQDRVLPYLNHPQVGLLIALWNTKKADLVDREGLFIGQMAPMREWTNTDQKATEKFNQQKRQVNLIRSLANKFLANGHITGDDLDQNKFVGYEGSDDKIKTSFINDIWHQLVQFTVFYQGDKIKKYLPDGLSLSRDEAEKTINAVLEDMVKSGGERKLNQKLVLEASGKE